jgi:hypothetical protein
MFPLTDSVLLRAISQKMARTHFCPKPFRVIAYNGAYQSLTLTNGGIIISDLIDCAGDRGLQSANSELQDRAQITYSLPTYNGAAHSLCFSSTEYWIIEPENPRYGYYHRKRRPLMTATLAIIRMP